MSAPLLLDLTHTSHTRARTGIQRVARSLHEALSRDACAVTHDPYLGAWRALESWELANLADDSAAGKRGAHWQLSAKLRGRLRRFAARPLPPASRLPHEASGILVPEVFSPAVAAALPALFARASGPRVAVFHDAIALKFPELTPPKTVARFPRYLDELLAFDGIAANSEDSCATLLDHWARLGLTNLPRVQAIPLGVDVECHVIRDTRPETDVPVVLSVGSIEGRKNHLALLEACDRLWSRGVKFELRLIGLAQPQTGGAALTRIHSLQSAGRPLRYAGPVDNATVEAAYADCAFTVYPSLIEGFGLPVIESLAHGKPCVCSARGAIGESARGGGCVMLASVDAANLAAAIERLLATPAELDGLSAAARARTFRSWRDYTAELTAWMHTLVRRD